MQQFVDHTVEKMLKIRTIVLAGALLPGIGCYFCVAYTYLFQFERVLNFTQGQVCPNVHNFMPPVSYSIGVWEPQKYFWQIIMFIHIPPRAAFLVLYRRLFSCDNDLSGTYGLLISLFTASMWLEIIGGIIVTVFPVHLFWLHSTGYTIWITAFNFNMGFSVALHHYGGIRKQMELTFWIKFILFITGFLLSISTAITFPLFVNFCSNPAYLAFSIAEYALIGLNSCFYCLIYWEFPKTRLTVGIRTGPHPKKLTIEKVNDDSREFA